MKRTCSAVGRGVWKRSLRKALRCPEKRRGRRNLSPTRGSTHQRRITAKAVMKLSSAVALTRVKKASSRGERKDCNQRMKSS